jgi:hypothetical protein
MQMNIFMTQDSALLPVSSDITCSCRYEIVYMDPFCIGYLNEQANPPGIPDPVTDLSCHMLASSGCPCRSIRTFIIDSFSRCPG